MNCCHSCNVRGCENSEIDGSGKPRGRGAFFPYFSHARLERSIFNLYASEQIQEKTSARLGPIVDLSWASIGLTSSATSSTSLEIIYSVVCLSCLFPSILPNFASQSSSKSWEKSDLGWASRPIDLSSITKIGDRLSKRKGFSSFLEGFHCLHVYRFDSHRFNHCKLLLHQTEGERGKAHKGTRHDQ